jgi:UDP-galactose transporter B1
VLVSICSTPSCLFFSHLLFFLLSILLYPLYLHFVHSYVIYPIQVLAKSCKPVPVMLMGAAMGKVYPAKKYANVVMIVLGVALFMGAGDGKKPSPSDGDNDANASPSQIIGIVLLFVSLCFDGGTGAYEDKLMSVHSVQPFDLMYNIQLGKTLLAFIGLLVLNELHIFIQMVQEMGFLLVALGLSGALGQVFIFVTISKFGALTCSIIGLARKVTTLVASIYFYGHRLNSLQFTGLMISVGAMVMNFWGKKGGGGGGHDNHNGPPPKTNSMPEEMQKMLDGEPNDDDDDSGGDVEMLPSPKELV